MVSGQEHDRLPYVELDEERPDKVQSDIGRSGTERLRDPGDVGPDVLQLGEALILQQLLRHEFRGCAKAGATNDSQPRRFWPRLRGGSIGPEP